MGISAGVMLILHFYQSHSEWIGVCVCVSAQGNAECGDNYFIWFGTLRVVMWHVTGWLTAIGSLSTLSLLNVGIVTYNVAGLLIPAAMPKLNPQPQSWLCSGTSLNMADCHRANRTGSIQNLKKGIANATPCPNDFNKGFLGGGDMQVGPNNSSS